jgi:uncharacterized protein (DUF983 family)
MIIRCPHCDSSTMYPGMRDPAWSDNSLSCIIDNNKKKKSVYNMILMIMIITIAIITITIIMYKRV